MPAQDFAPIEWKVPSQGIPSTAGPICRPTRSRISRAALLVKVTQRISLRPGAPGCERCARRVVSAARLARARARQHQHRPVQRLDGLAAARDSGRRGRVAPAPGARASARRCRQGQAHAQAAEARWCGSFKSQNTLDSLDAKMGTRRGRICEGRGLSGFSAPGVLSSRRSPGNKRLSPSSSPRCARPLVGGGRRVCEAAIFSSRPSTAWRHRARLAAVHIDVDGRGFQRSPPGSRRSVHQLLEIVQAACCRSR